MSNLIVGKLYEYIGKSGVLVLDCNPALPHLGRLTTNSTFVVVECLGIFTTKAVMRLLPNSSDLHSVKILTPEGKVGQCALWPEEVKSPE